MCATTDGKTVVGGRLETSESASDIGYASGLRRESALARAVGGAGVTPAHKLLLTMATLAACSGLDAVDLGPAGPVPLPKHPRAGGQAQDGPGQPSTRPRERRRQRRARSKQRRKRSQRENRARFAGRGKSITQSAHSRLRCDCTAKTVDQWAPNGRALGPPRARGTVAFRGCRRGFGRSSTSELACFPRGER